MQARLNGTPPSGQQLPTLEADLLLLHAPAVFDFRERSDIYFPFLGTSGDVPITPLYEYFPVGFKTLQRFLSERHHDVALLNLAVLLLRYPRLAFETVIEALDVRLLGIDLHWMVHVQGSLEVAERIKALRPDLRIVFGGISASYYADELIRYPFVDMVMRGYDTHAPMAALLTAMKGDGRLSAVANLLWKSPDGVHDNALSHLPNSFSCGIDWSLQPPSQPRKTLPIAELMSTQNAGCAFNCGWCGGSREAFERIYSRRRAMARKPREELAYEFDSIRRLEGNHRYHFYSVGTYNETRRGLSAFLDEVEASDFRSISYEQFHLTPKAVLERMAAANPRTTITLSPESHDMRIAKLSGRGVYTNEQLERWIETALACGIHQIDIWYFVGMPQQDADSVMQTVDYCQRLLTRFSGQRVNPMVCPMIPFLDPASTFFESPERHGYRVFHRTLDQHRRAMGRASILHRINYETQHLTRRDLVHVGFGAVRRLMQAKADARIFPRSWVDAYVAKIDDALAFIDVVHEADSIVEPAQRARALGELGEGILERNEMVLFGGVQNQAFPMHREIGGRWFDELGWPLDALAAAVSDA